MGLLLAAGSESSQEETPARRRGGKSDETRRPKIKWTKRKTYTDWSERYWDERKKLEDQLAASLFGVSPVEAKAEVVIPQAEPPALIEAAPAVERDRLVEMMQAAQAAFAERASQLQKLALQRIAEQARVELPTEGQNEKAEQQALLDWLEARRLWVERQRIEADLLAQELEEEEVIMLLLAA